MIFYPAIDIKSGKCIRLEKGLLQNIKYYNENPVDQALEFEKMGCEWIHVVDIDGAFSGNSFNQEIVFEIKQKSNCKIQVGGGIRNFDTIDKYLSNSIDKVILGTAAIKDPDFVKEACRNFPGKIIIGIDSKNKMVASDGWSETSSISTIELAKKFEDVGVESIIFTDINKDGLLQGMNLVEIQNLLKSTNLKIIASGGVSSLDDLKKIKNIKCNNLEGVISGKAIYEKKFSIQEALKVLS